METKKVKDLKEELKTESKAIRALKDDIKVTFQRQEYAGKKQFSLIGLRTDVRHRLIAYGLLKGTERARIETPAEDNLPNEARIQEIVALYA